MDSISFIIIFQDMNIILFLWVVSIPYVWNYGASVSVDETVKAQIKSLRKKLASVGKNYIQNEWGVGYKFVLPKKL